MHRLTRIGLRCVLLAALLVASALTPDTHAQLKLGNILPKLGGNGAPPRQTQPTPDNSFRPSSPTTGRPSLLNRPNTGGNPSTTENWRPNRAAVTIVPDGGNGNTYVTPAPVTAVTPAPVATPPQARPPRTTVTSAALKAPGNQVGTAKPVGPKLVDDVAAQVDRAIVNQLEDMPGRFQPPLITADEVDALVGMVPDPVKAGALRDKLADGTPNEVYQAARDAGFPEAKARALKNNATVTGAFNDYKQTVLSGASATVTAVKVSALKQAMKDVGASPAAQDKVQKPIDQTALLAALRQNIRGGAATAGGGPARPGGVYFVSVPGVPAGEVYYINAGTGTLVTGTGEAGTLSVSTAAPTADLAAAPPPAGGELVLYNPTATRAPISFTVDGQPFKLDAGYVQRVPGAGPFTIEFDRGGTPARYSLDPRNYEFTRDQQRWDVYAKTYKATIDNSTNRGNFGFLIDDQTATVPTGQRAELKSEVPLVVLFDRGDGKEPARKELGSGVYEVRINPRTRLLDLFRQGESVGGN